MSLLSKLKAFLIKGLWLKKWPSRSQWWQFFKAPHQIFGGRERIVFFTFLVLFLSSFFFLVINFYFKNTGIIATDGGVFVEGVAGQPRWIQPIYASTNDVDRDLVELIYSGLMQYDKDGRIIPDLAKDFPKISEDGKVYEFYLKDNLFWQDGKPLTADDVIFTIQIIQNSDYKSPLRISWLGVQIEKISEKALRLKLKNSYSSFLETTALKILPKHIWQNVSPENFPLAIYNLKPIGSGPFKSKEIKQDETGRILLMDLVRNQKYYGKLPYLNQISFRFFENEEDLIKAVKNREVDGFSLSSAKDFKIFKERGFLDYHLSLPRYFAVFFNPNPPAGGSKILAEKEIRQALNCGINKKEILEKVLLNKGIIIESPILPEIYGFNKPSETYEFNLEKAKEILEKAGFTESETGVRKKIIKKETAFKFKNNLSVGSKGKEVEELQKCLSRLPEIYPEGQITGIFGEKTKEAVIRFQKQYTDTKGTGSVGTKTREKLNEMCFKPGEEELILKFSLITVDEALLVETANILKDQWQKLGVELEIKMLDVSTLEFEREVIKPRNYEILLFGEVLGTIPDPFPFWHSSQKIDPGLNLAVYENKKADKLLETARQTLDDNKRKETLEEFQDILIKDAPVIFLYSPDYIYLSSKKIKGIEAKNIVDPSKRFTGIENWYIKTKRVLK